MGHKFAAFQFALIVSINYVRIVSSLGERYLNIEHLQDSNPDPSEMPTSHSSTQVTGYLSDPTTEKR
jgi:hypothetical protein